MMQGFHDVAQRIVNAQNGFINEVKSQFNTTEEQAVKVFLIFRKVKAIKLDAGIGRYKLTHGGFWEQAVIQKAIEYKESI